MTSSASPEGASATAQATSGDGAEEADALEAAQRQRIELRKTHPGLEASTGMFRTHYAASGPAGTFRFGILTSYFTDEAFLCPQCSDPDGGPGSTKDNVSRVGAHIQLSATPLDFLEAYLAIHSTATSNTRGDPELLQVLGDTNWGLKAFMSHEPDQTVTAGGAAELWLLNGTGGVGIDRASVALRALSSFDLSNRSNVEERVPLRINLNLGYIFDNSGKLVEEIESERRRRITRIERYGLNVNRLDRLVPALGIEGMFEAVRPYIEWSLDIPTNRQDYRCSVADVYASDVCLEKHVTLAAAPSRVTLGARGYAFMDGLGFHAALDIGTGGTTPPFWEEVQPETPWNVHVGIAYAADIKPKVEIRRIRLPAPPIVERPNLTIRGTIVEEGTQTPVPNAIVRYQGRQVTGMVSDEAGRFTTAPLEPGSYTFTITATDYEDGTCTADVKPSAPPPTAPTAPSTPPAPDATGAVPPPPAAADTASPGESDDTVTELRCELKAKPKLGSVIVYALDELSNEPLPFAKITAVDSLGRPLSLEADDQGAVAFVNVLPGNLTLTVEAEGYLRATATVQVEPKAETRKEVPVFKRPKRSNLNVTTNEIKLRKPIEFTPGTAELVADSRAVIDELAELLRNDSNLGPIEIQSHTDAGASPTQSQALSTQRANVVREALIKNGVSAQRVLARGYGDSKPLAPNTNEPNRKRNNRIEIVVQEATVLPQ